MFENLQSKLSATLRRLRGLGLLSDKDVEENLRAIRLALLEADVHYTVVKDFIASVKDKMAGMPRSIHLSPGEQVSRIVYDELVRILGGKNQGLGLKGNPAVLMLVGLQGSGKTTTAVKLASLLMKEGRRPYLISVDVYRPAAMEQLEQFARKSGVSVHHGDTSLSPRELVVRGLAALGKSGHDLAVVDTAGRLHIDEEMMQELVDLKALLRPSEIILVTDGMAGQDAVQMAKSFDEKVGLTGVILSKMEGDARGGAALSVFTVTGKPVKFVGTGERAQDLEPFHPERIASRMLGMGDMLTLVDRAAEIAEKDDSRAVADRIRESGTITFDDLLVSFRQMRKLGPIANLLEMLPGVGGALKGADAPDERQIDRMEAIILSMTPAERTNPRLLDGSRKRRIAAGSGTTVQEVNRILRQIGEMEMLMKRMGITGKGRKNVLKKFPFRFH